MTEETNATDSAFSSAAQLKAIVERIERLQEEIDALQEDMKELYAEAKGNGFDTKVLRTIIKIRQRDPTEVAEAEALKDLYIEALKKVGA